MSASNGRKPPLTAERRYGGSGGNGGNGGGRGDGGKPKARATAKPASRRAARARKPREPRQPRGPLGFVAALVLGLLRFVMRVVWGIGWRMALALTLVVGLGVAYYAAQLPPVTDLVDGRARGSVTMLDRDGATFAWRGDQFGGMITADTISPHLRNAVVATEDRRFWWHPGIDPQGIASAVRINLSEGRGPLSGNGGSTITQQTAKLLCLGKPFDASVWKNESEYEADCRRTTLWRKVQEAVYAMAMEARYSKDEILTIYLNRAYLGAGTRGFEAASQRYFGKPAAQVNPAEAAMLAGLLKAPTTYAPTNNLSRSQGRASVIVGLMQDQGYLSAAEAEAARANPATLSATAQQDQGGYFADWVMDTGPEFFTRDTTEDVVIRTTLDPRIQTAAEKALLQVFEERVSPGSEAQAAIVVMSADGAVRAMVGGRNVKASGAFNRATQALRQTGSSFKPFIYAAALDLGMQPYDLVDDSPLTMNIPGSGAWSPENYDRKYDGMVTLTEALAESRNIPAVKVSEQVGRENVRTVASMFGIDSDLAAGPALALGVSESTLLEMTGAYAGILNGGSSVTPYGLLELKLKGDDTPLMGTGGGIGERVISQDAAEKLTWMMSRVVAEGTGSRAQIDGWEVAGKTGTTQGARDAWFVGFAGDYVAGVWMGYDDNRPLSGVTGGGLPATIWRETMVRVLEGQPVKPLPMRVPEPSQAPEAIAGSENVSPSGGQASDPETDRILREMLGQPEPAQQQQAQPAQQQPDRERVILDVLNSILGAATN
ncbi:transglycosylase domain-containing protein [Limimaricola variabilis]|uniref:transglycosylase domain-containing protein n=1 Tax=Limimaricola variabilis TaxID=1492771 RepID=UPI002AC8AAD5|nr:transglycosylase domain-containing protein [Limimaricola variabilis]WPY93507.1 transglycosylase domain-containing protein [Limimaricola variabilis]